MEDDACREDIAYWSDFLAFFKSGHFWGHVAWSSTTVEDVVVPVDIGCQPKIDQHWLQFIPEHDIFWFNVPVHDIIVVKFLEPADKTYHDMLDFSYCKLAHSLVDLAMQVAASQQLQHHVKGVRRLEHSLQSYQIAVVDRPHYSYFVQKVEPMALIFGLKSVLL